ncbi:alpha/beta hydrolase fold domain-containing protein [Bacillus sp. OV166]
MKCAHQFHDARCRSFSNETQCIVISVEYSLAPEHKSNF